MGGCCTTDTAVPENTINIERRNPSEGNLSALLEDQQMMAPVDTTPMTHTHLGSNLGSELKPNLLSPIDSWAMLETDDKPNNKNKKKRSKPKLRNKGHNIDSIKSDGSIIRERSGVFTFQDSNGVIMFNPGAHTNKGHEASCTSLELGNPQITALKDDISAYSEQIYSDLDLRTDDDFDDDINNMIVIDNGSHTLKIGFSGSDTHIPSKTFPSIIGRPKSTMHLNAVVPNDNQIYFGHDANEKSSILDLSNVIERGKIMNWDWLESIYDYSFRRELAIPQNRSMNEYNVLITECVHSDDADREKCAQLMFETYGINSMFLANAACLSLYGTGRVTGTVLGIGYGVTYSAGIYEGSCIPQSVIKCLSAGYDITQYLKQILSEKFDRILKNTKHKIYKDMKEKCCFIAPNASDETHIKSHKDEQSGTKRVTLSFKKYKLPDGKVIRIGSERSRAGEKLFGGFMNLNPEFGTVNESGIQHMINQSIKSVQIQDLESELYKNIVLSGGSTLFDGLVDRLTNEMNILTEEKEDINIIASDKRECLAWIGGSILSSLSNHRQNFIFKDDYEDEGPSIIHRRCPK